MDPLSLVRLRSFMNTSSGNPDITIGMIDGPLELSHPAFQGSRITTVKESQLVACSNASSIACRHGTFVAGILCAKRGLGAPAICPGCTLLLRPIFTDQTVEEHTNNTHILVPTTTPEDLSDAIIEVIDTGAKIINLSLGLSTSSLLTYSKLQEAYDYACKNDVIIVVAAGNQGNIGSTSVLHHDWIIPVAACNEYGVLDPISNFGPSIGSRGLLAPGINITSTSSGDGYLRMSGTSFAAPFITGAVALLWSVYPTVSAARLIDSVRRGASDGRRYRSMIPPLLNVEAAYHILRSTVIT
jgi:subtilisin family serine protease